MEAQLQTQEQILPENKLGPRMLKAVIERLQDTLDHYRFASPYLAKIDDELTTASEDGEWTTLTLTEMLAIIEKYTENCRLVNKMHEHFVRDIYMRSKHYRIWRGETYYLSEHLVYSSECIIA